MCWFIQVLCCVVMQVCSCVCRCWCWCSFCWTLTPQESFYAIQLPIICFTCLRVCRFLCFALLLVVVSIQGLFLFFLFGHKSVLDVCVLVLTGCCCESCHCRCCTASTVVIIVDFSALWLEVCSYVSLLQVIA